MVLVQILEDAAFLLGDDAGTEIVIAGFVQNVIQRRAPLMTFVESDPPPIAVIEMSFRGIPII
jgi:hypothetical protein